jgi:hypothetical protein
MLILFMVPLCAYLLFDLYLTVTVKEYLEERIWRAAPKVKHVRKQDDETEQPVKTELIPSEISCREGIACPGGSASSEDERTPSSNRSQSFQQ